VRRAAYKAYELTHPDEPWLAQGAVRYLDAELTGEGAGIEWGSGRSTKWLGNRLTHLLSVEHDLGWYESVRRKVASVPAVELRHVPLDHRDDEPTVPHYDQLPRYVAVAHEFEDGSLDLALVDGHYRQACIKAVMPKLRPGGLLVVDNTDWLALSEWGVATGWRIEHQSKNVMTQTTVWRRLETART